MNKKDRIRTINRYLYMLAGLMICAIAYNLFMVPNELAAGNATGLALIINAALGYNIAITVAVFNIAVLFLSWIFLGKKATVNSVVGSLVLPVFVALTEPLVKVLNFEGTTLFLVSIFAGLLDGLGNGMVFKVGFTTGGTDIINKIIERYGKVSLGAAILLSDGLIALSGAYFFGPREAVYSFFILYLTSIATDKVVLGISQEKSLLIITRKDEEIKNYIADKFKRSVTTLVGAGAYSDTQKNVVFCVIPNSKYKKLTKAIEKIDKEAFFSVSDSYQVIGGNKHV